jgi:hypothetical protein
MSNQSVNDPESFAMRLLFVADLHYALKQFDWLVAHAAELTSIIFRGPATPARKEILPSAPATPHWGIIRSSIQT